ncbi:2-oxo acid dehydrogenase subunit E2 [Dehalococcoidia bacterium]|nr:2-oxo acid dehydrogenase subunit E2 [Dehalococcoidia bacterium]
MIIELPQVGESVTEGVIGKWMIQVGQSVEKYDPLVEVITDKVTMELPSPVSGVLTSILASEGTTVLMGAPIAEMEVEGIEAELPADSLKPSDVNRIGELLTDVAPVGPTGTGNAPVISRTEHKSKDNRERHSPAVLRLAKDHGVDLDLVDGTGIGRRITRDDVQQFIDQDRANLGASQGVQSDDEIGDPIEERSPLTPVRRMIADRMAKSATEIPQAWTLVEVDVSHLVELRLAVRSEFEEKEGINLTYLPFVVKVVAECLKENPLINSSWSGTYITLKKQINIGLAAAAPDGLVVPVVHDADTLSLPALAQKVFDLTSRARRGQLRLEDVHGGTFTLNNTGVLGSIASQPLVNYPQAAILTTEAIVKRPVVIDDAIAIRSMMNLCLSFDHRVIDGAEASAFVSSVKNRLEAIEADMGIY